MDETYREVADILFGGGASELVSKLEPGSKQHKAAYNASIAGNTIATVGGVHALGMSLKELSHSGKKQAHGKHMAGPKLNPNLKKIPGGVKAGKVAIKLGEAIRNHPKAAGGLAVGWTGLHGAELASDLSSRHALKENYKRELADKKVKKSEPGSSDLHLPTTGAMKRKVYLKAIDQVGAVQTIKRPKNVVKNLDVTWEGEISKVDVDRRQVFGWASIVEVNGEPVVDLQGDYISIDEVEKSAYEYVQKSRKGGDMHLRDEWNEPKHASDMIESFVVTDEKKKALGLPDSTPTGWWVGYQVNDPDVWSKVKSGERTGFSIHGRGQRSPM